MNFYNNLQFIKVLINCRFQNIVSDSTNQIPPSLKCHLSRLLHPGHFHFTLVMNFLLVLFGVFAIVRSQIITITWTTPPNVSKPATTQETLKAIFTHLQALHLAQLAPRLLGLQNTLQIKLCPPQPFDPLVKEFTVPRIAGYSALYDHNCIQRNMAIDPQWGSKPKPSPAPLAPLTPGYSVPAFIYQLYKASNQLRPTEEPVWLIDSTSLHSWFTAPTLNYLAKPNNLVIPPAQLMKQINSMHGALGERDLKNMPQAIQGSLLIVLPDYSSWRQNLPIKTFFNPVWWSTRQVPRSKQPLLVLLERIIKITRTTDQQLVIIHHEPTPFNFDLVDQLAKIFGEKQVISSTSVLPKTATTLQTLQFIQKAAGLVVDKRHLLGQLGLLSTGFPHSVHHFQQFLPYTTAEIILMSVLAIWVTAVLGITAFHTHKVYEKPLHQHALHIILALFLASGPVIALNPSLWPTPASYLVFSLFEAGYSFILYGLVIFYATAALITAIIFAHHKYKKNPLENDEISDNITESLHLIHK